MEFYRRIIYGLVQVGCLRMVMWSSLRIVHCLYLLRLISITLWCSIVITWVYFLRLMWTCLVVLPYCNGISGAVIRINPHSVLVRNCLKDQVFGVCIRPMVNRYNQPRLSTLLTGRCGRRTRHSLATTRETILWMDLQTALM